jgi:hypothetical protein
VATRIVDPTLLQVLHLRWRSCALCGEVWQRLSLHHVIPRSAAGDDVIENLVMLCGSGTTGCHGMVEAGDAEARAQLGVYLYQHRLDTLNYIREKLGLYESNAWLERHLFLVFV